MKRNSFKNQQAFILYADNNYRHCQDHVSYGCPSFRNRDMLSYHSVSIYRFANYTAPSHWQIDQVIFEYENTDGAFAEQAHPLRSLAQIAQGLLFYLSKTPDRPRSNPAAYP